MSTRASWVSLLERIVRPVLSHAAARTLRSALPVETSGQDRERFSHLEAFSRSLLGLSPWLELGEPASRPWADLARAGLDAIGDPANFGEGGQTLVEAAFLAQALLHAPRTLWDPLSPKTKDNLRLCFQKSRNIQPHDTNWLLFSAMVETALFVFDGDWREEPVLHAFRKFDGWYLGDGIYGDGPPFHADYYNSFVIHPMLVDIAAHFGDRLQLGKFILPRAIRHAVLQERLISPEGTFPPVGRSLCYRCGAFHALAQIALLQQLPACLSPAQVRCALTAVIRRSMETPGTFDEAGWLRLGFCGAQPGLGEAYISTGSLYLCTTAFLPLGLPEGAPFWSDPDEKWTSARAWGGENFPIDAAISF